VEGGGRREEGEGGTNSKEGESGDPTNEVEGDQKEAKMQIVIGTHFERAPQSEFRFQKIFVRIHFELKADEALNLSDRTDGY